MAGAIEKWMAARRGGGWPTAWDIAVWARLERGDKVGEIERTFVRHSPAPNLHNQGANQSDATFGLTAAIAEALLQSHAGELSLLPALPVGWRDGSVTSLRARGGFEVSLAWKRGQLESAEISRRDGGPCQVRSGAKTAALTLKPGARIRLDADLAARNP